MSVSGVRNIVLPANAFLRRRSCGKNEVQIKVSHCGICHSDLCVLRRGRHASEIEQQPAGKERRRVLVVPVVAAASRQSGSSSPMHAEPLRPTHAAPCHAGTYMLKNEWGNTIYPIVPGHEV